ncbi:MAG: hypothetical protein ABIQ30_14985 [Devosia sp.]
MLIWTKVTTANADELRRMIAHSRLLVGQLTPGNGGAFRARTGLELYFSPAVTSVLKLTTHWPLEECATPDGMAVEVVAGPYDQPSWYDQPPESVEEVLDIGALDDLGLIGPDTDIAELRHAHFGRS